MNGDGVGSLLVYTRFHGGITNPVFNQSSQLGDRWVEAAVDAVLIYAESVRYFLLPMRRMRICFTDVFFLFFCFFSVRHKIPDSCSRERLNGFS